MSYDGITMAAVCGELNKNLIGARVEKVYQPRKLEIYIHLRNRENNFILLCSADARQARVHLAKTKQDNPAAPPSFCMLLRKHLIGAKLVSVKQVGLDRILILTFHNSKDMVLEPHKYLICEIMGKHSNLILAAPTEKEQWQILGSIKNVPSSMSRYREVLPGEIYRYPPAHPKMSPNEVTEERLAAAICSIQESSPEHMLVALIMGPGLDMARELVFRASGGEPLHPLEIVRGLTIELSWLSDILREESFSPCIAKPDMETSLFSPIPLKRFHPDTLSFFPSVNEALDVYYTMISLQHEEKELKLNLTQSLNNTLSRIIKKRTLQEKDIRSISDADRFRLYGEMLTAHLHSLKRTADFVEVINYYSSTQETLRIPIDMSCSIQENAKKYFKKYRKLKDSSVIKHRRLKETIQEIKYLESIQAALTYADLENLYEIRNEMELGGIIKKTKIQKEKPRVVFSPRHHVSSDGIDIYIGKNNRQNDLLTLKTAAPDDIWMHTKDIPGSHVIIKSSDPPDQTLLEAAQFAVRYSKGAASSNVPVDYTHVRHVRKVKGAKPGMVIYDHHHTLYVTLEN